MISSQKLIIFDVLTSFNLIYLVVWNFLCTFASDLRNKMFNQLNK